MSDEKFDKLLEVMFEVKETVDGLQKTVIDLDKRVGNLEAGQKEMNEKLDRIEDNNDLLAQKNWQNEKDIYRIKKLMGVE